jgi:protein-S-isoprenylcysteine O-methyltransferase Ste14
MAAPRRRVVAQRLVRLHDAAHRHPDRPQKAGVQAGHQRTVHYTRNPAYLSMTTIYAGVAALRNALWAIFFVPLVVYVIQRDKIEREEQYMERVFGEEYLNYKTSVRR